MLTSGASGVGFTTTLVLVGLLARPLTMAITEYFPVNVEFELGMLMDGELDENPFGPVQKYNALAAADAVNETADPSQTMELPETTGGAGFAFNISELGAPVVVMI